jgi:hypothetical protein
MNLMKRTCFFTSILCTVQNVGIAGVLKRTAFGKLFSSELNKKKKIGFSSCPAWLQFTQQLTAGRN